ncbi:MAG: DUF2062 domain-containing protein, partial [Nibricoccus sp.]
VHLSDVTQPPSQLPPAAAAQSAKRNFWQRRVRDPLVAQLTQGITPEKIALTLAVGTACALFPIIGTTTLLCALAAIALRLNQPIIQLLNQACWPIHIPVALGCIRFGERIFSAPHVSFNFKRVNHLFWDEPRVFFHEFGDTVLHAIVAWSLLAPVFILVVYFLTLPITRRVARLKAKTDEASP